VSLGGNLGQHHFASKAAENSAAELKLNQEKFSVERDKLVAEAEKLKTELTTLQQNSQNTATDRAVIQSELDKVNTDIRTYDTAIQKHQIQLKMYDFNAQLEADGKDKSKAETAKHIADTERSTLDD
jgi:predicted enzyme involved in methoxymalonyl-ACP biosynthesis